MIKKLFFLINLTVVSIHGMEYMPKRLQEMCANTTGSTHTEGAVKLMCKILEDSFKKAVLEFYPENSFYFPTTYQESKDRGVLRITDVVLVVKTLAEGLHKTPEEIISITKETLAALKAVGTGIAPSQAYYPTSIKNVLETAKRATPLSRDASRSLEGYYYCAQNMNVASRDIVTEEYNAYVYAYRDLQKTGMPERTELQQTITNIAQGVGASPSFVSEAVSSSEAALKKLSRGKNLR